VPPTRRFPTLRLLVPLAAFVAGCFILGGIGLAAVRVCAGLLAGTPLRGLWSGCVSLVWAIAAAVTVAAVGEMLELLLHVAAASGAAGTAERPDGPRVSRPAAASGPFPPAPPSRPD